jgi:hypothetical protein
LLILTSVNDNGEKIVAGVVDVNSNIGHQCQRQLVQLVKASAAYLKHTKLSISYKSIVLKHTTITRKLAVVVDIGEGPPIYWRILKKFKIS